MTHQVVVSEGKHGNEYYLAETKDYIKRAYAAIIFSWLDQGYLQESGTKPPTEEEREVLDMTPESINALPRIAQSNIKALRARAIRAQEAYERDAKIDKMVSELSAAQTIDDALALRTEDGRSLVQNIIDIYKGNEYMEIYVDTLVKP